MLLWSDLWRNWRCRIKVAMPYAHRREYNIVKNKYAQLIKAIGGKAVPASAAALLKNAPVLILDEATSARHRIRAPRAGCAGSTDARPHDVGDCAPAVDDQESEPHRRARWWAYRRNRDPCRAAGAGREIRATLSQPVSRTVGITGVIPRVSKAAATVAAQSASHNDDIDIQVVGSTGTAFATDFRRTYAILWKIDRGLE